MSVYRISYSPIAELDLESAHEWGSEFWGQDKADKWLDQIDELVRTRLAHSPLSCAIAPESQTLGYEVRHLIIHRYRILFTVENGVVNIVRVSGPFSGQTLEFE